MRKDFFVKLIPYLVIGVYGVMIDIAVSNFFFNQILAPNLGKISFIENSSFDYINYIVAPLSALLGGIVGLINNFIMNEFFVYKKEIDNKKIFKRFLKYTTAIIIGSFIIGKFIVLSFCVSYLHLGFTSANLIAIVIGTFINYPINYFWTWGNKTSEEKVQKLLEDSPLEV